MRLLLRGTPAPFPRVLDSRKIEVVNEILVKRRGGGDRGFFRVYHVSDRIEYFELSDNALPEELPTFKTICYAYF